MVSFKIYFYFGKVPRDPSIPLWDPVKNTDEGPKESWKCVRVAEKVRSHIIDVFGQTSHYFLFVSVRLQAVENFFHRFILMKFINKTWKKGIRGRRANHERKNLRFLVSVVTLLTKH